jgi:cytochrome P450
MDRGPAGEGGSEDGTAFDDIPYIASMLNLTTYAEIDEVLRLPAFVPARRDHAHAFAHGTLITLGGDSHFERRRLEAPLFGRDALERFKHEMLKPLIEESLAELAVQCDADGVVRADLVPLTRGMLLKIAAGVIGIDGVDTPEQAARFGWFAERLGEAFAGQWSTRDPDDIVREGLEVRAQFVEEFFGPSLERRRAIAEEGRDSGQPPKDLLSLLEQEMDRSVPEWDDEFILREATLFLSASIGTTSGSATHVVWHLNQWWDRHPEDRALAGDSDFLQAAIAEALRLHPPAPFFLRLCTEDTVLKSGRKIEADQTVALRYPPANRGREVFGDDAGEFDPHRTPPAGIKPWGLSFGGGPHLCLGRPLATGVGRSGDMGTVAQIVMSLLDAGLELVPEEPPVPHPISLLDAFETFPVRLTNLAASRC